MYRGSSRCDDCSGEDCVCCEVYLEDRMNQLHCMDPDERDDYPEDDYDNRPDEDCYPEDDMDGDHDSALTSVGWGTDEDYGSFGGDDFD